MKKLTLAALLAIFFLFFSAAAEECGCNASLLNDSDIVAMYAQWGHYGANQTANLTGIEGYYLFNIAGCDQGNLSTCDLYDPFYTVKELRDAGVLVNYVILRDGVIWQLADDGDNVWHARGHNADTLGIRVIALNETVAKKLSEQTGKTVLPGPNEIQLQKLAQLIATLKHRYPAINTAYDYQYLKGGTVANSTIDWHKVDWYLKNRHQCACRFKP
ncbi:MAG: N-acetylmuramoyl-L-alanine amidase [Candidatus Nealsonbacteria bacterium]|nr:N-acetylmuramoyl-L-alanine amidase [Candidatus Nealsonbacteria bacterium]